MYFVVHIYVYTVVELLYSMYVISTATGGSSGDDAPVGAIVGGVIGGIIAAILIIVIIILIYVFCIRNRDSGSRSSM